MWPEIYFVKAVKVSDINKTKFQVLKYEYIF